MGGFGESETTPNACHVVGGRVIEAKTQPAIQGLWIGDRLSDLERLCISSFIKNGHQFHLYVYDDLQGVPDRTVLHDANEILPASRIFKYQRHQSVAGFSNMFRYKLLLDRGGYWVDMDVVCLRPFEFESDHVFVRVREKSRLGALSKRSHVSTWFLKANAGSEIMSYCYESAAERDPEQLEWGDTGATLLTRAVEEFDMEDRVVPRGTFPPFYWWQWRQLLDGSARSTRRWRHATRTAVAVHLYNEMWRRGGVDKNAEFPTTSVYEQLKRRYIGPG